MQPGAVKVVTVGSDTAGAVSIAALALAPAGGLSSWKRTDSGQPLSPQVTAAWYSGPALLTGFDAHSLPANLNEALGLHLSNWSPKTCHQDSGTSGTESEKIIPFSTGWHLIELRSPPPASSRLVFLWL